MEKENLAKLVDAVINLAALLNLHPYTVIDNLASMFPDEKQRKIFISDIRAELVKMAHTLPWGF